MEAKKDYIPERSITAVKIATLADVREYGEGDPPELWLNDRGRITVRAWNECRNNYTDVDLFDLLEWAKTGVEKAESHVRNTLGTLPAAR